MPRPPTLGCISFGRYPRGMGKLLHGVVALLLLSAPCAAGAQPPDPGAEARASALRAAARRHADAGRLEEAFAAVHEASLLTGDPIVFLELGELADRLRLDEVALSAYETYLARRTDAPDRAAIVGRVRVLRLLLAGHRFVRPRAPAVGVALVDWSGRPAASSRDLIPLAEWDGTLRVRRPSPAPDLLPASVLDPGLGRRLSPP